MMYAYDFSESRTACQCSLDAFEVPFETYTAHSKAFLLLFFLVRLFEIGVGFTADFPVQWSEHASPWGEPICEGRVFDGNNCR